MKPTASLNVQIPAGPTFSTTWGLSIDAYDRASITIKKGQTGTLQLQPATAASVLLMVITSSDYTGVVSFAFNGTRGLPITQPQIVSGPGLLGLISAGPGQILFDNSKGTSDVNLEALVLRTALA
jgi:hypothetical protein